MTLNVATEGQDRPAHSQPKIFLAQDLYDNDIGGQTPEYPNSTKNQAFPERGTNQTPGERLLKELTEYYMKPETKNIQAGYMSNVVLQNGGYGNIIFNLMFLMQMRITKLFDGGKLHFD